MQATALLAAVRLCLVAAAVALYQQQQRVRALRVCRVCL
jgi:hypothetical protein